MNNNIRHKKSRNRRDFRVKMMLKNKSERPRLTVFRSNRFIYCQIIDDTKKKTMVYATEKELNLPKDKKLTKIERAKMIGLLIAQKALKEKINKIVFDRNSFRYHGRIEALAAGAREGGLKF